MEGKGFWPNGLSRILAETGLCEDGDGSPRSGLAEQRAPKSLTKSGQGELVRQGSKAYSSLRSALLLVLALA